MVFLTDKQHLTHSLWTRWFLRSWPTLWCQSLVGFPTASVEDDVSDPVSEDAGSPLHRETTVDETAQLTVDTADVDDGSMPSVLYIFSSDKASFCTGVAVVDVADGEEVTAVVVAVDVTRRSDAFFSGEHTGQSERTQFFQCQMICRSRAQCCTEDKYTKSADDHYNNIHTTTTIFTARQHSLLCRESAVSAIVNPSVRLSVTRWHWVKTTLSYDHGVFTGG